MKLGKRSNCVAMTMGFCRSGNRPGVNPSLHLVLCFVAMVLCSSAILAQPASRDGKTTSNSPFAETTAGMRASADESAVTVTPKPNELSLRTVKSVNGAILMLSVPVEIKNVSQQPVTMRLNHEWYGGIPPSTDLIAAVLVKGPERATWIMAPGYQAGNHGTIDKTVLPPGQTKRIDVRLNWPGTGSSPAERLIDETVSGTYPIRFLLFFESAGSRRFVESREVVLTVTPARRLVEVRYALDDKPPTGMFHAVRILWLTPIQRGASISYHNWASHGYRGIDDEAETKAAKCAQLLKAALQPTVLPTNPNQILTVGAMVDGKWVTKKFPIDKLPDETRKILTTLGIYDEDMRRFRFIE
jgi:hypothetical protein